MICEICKKNNASFYRTLPAFGKSVAVCPVCLSKISSKGNASIKGVGSGAPLSGFDFLRQMVEDFAPEFVDFYAENPQYNSRNQMCSNCGYEFNQYPQTGRLGCSVCYDIFKEHLTPIVHKIHHCVRHNGSRPK